MGDSTLASHRAPCQVRPQQLPSTVEKANPHEVYLWSAAACRRFSVAAREQTKESTNPRLSSAATLSSVPLGSFLLVQGHGAPCLLALAQDSAQAYECLGYNNAAQSTEAA